MRPRKGSRRHPPRIAAWLSGHADATILAAATAQGGGSMPLTLTGSFEDVLSRTIASQADTLVLHAHVASLNTLTSIRAAQITPVVVSTTGKVSVRNHNYRNTQFQSSEFCRSDFLVAAAAAVAPLVIERKGDVERSFFNVTDGSSGKRNSTSSTDETALLRQQEIVDDRSPSQRLIAWLTRVYLPNGYPHTTTPDYISFTKYRTLQNLASAIMQVIRLVHHQPF